MYGGDQRSARPWLDAAERSVGERIDLGDSTLLIHPENEEGWWNADGCVLGAPSYDLDYP